MKVALAFAALAICIVINAEPTPIVLWHGMGDTCCYPWSMGRIEDLLKKNLPGVYVHSIMVGSNVEEDELNGFLMNGNDQVSLICDRLKRDPVLNSSQSINAIGFSQGGQFIRGFVERCNVPQVKNLITLGAQHEGVYGLPNCPGPNTTLCEWARKLLDYGAYFSFIQEHITQAGYWHDPLAESEYLKSCVYIPDINNARDQRNALYKQRLTSLENFIMVMFESDSVVQPRESSWFGFYKPGQDSVVEDMRSRPIYTEDWIGLQQLDKLGRLKLLSSPGNHLRFTDEWFLTNIIKPYLA